MNFVGVDACKKGWFAVALDGQGNWDAGIFKSVVDHSLKRFMRKDLARDDILDAIILAVSASLPLSSLRTVPSNPPRDKKGLPMEIVYFAPE